MPRSDQIDFVTNQIERIFELAGAYVLCGGHEETAAPEDLASVMKSIGFDDKDPLDVTAMIGAKTLVSFYSVIRGMFGEEVTDEVWQVFVQLNAAHRAEVALEMREEENGGE